MTTITPVAATAVPANRASVDSPSGIRRSFTDVDAGFGAVLYDGLCPLCLRSVRILKRLDWLKRLRFQDARMPAGWPPSAQPLVMERMLEEMHVVTPNRKQTHAGFKAFRWIARQLPLLWPFVPFMYLPGVPWIGRKAYLWVARHRYQLVSCHNGVCEVPKRK